MCLLLLLILDFHLDLPLLLLEFLLTLLFLSKEIHILPLLRLPRLEITPHLFIAIPLVELLHLLDLFLADHVPVVAKTVMGSLVSIPEWFPHFKIKIITKFLSAITRVPKRNFAKSPKS